MQQISSPPISTAQKKLSSGSLRSESLLTDAISLKKANLKRTFACNIINKT